MNAETAHINVRCRVALLKIVPLDAVLTKLGIAKPQLIFSHEVMHFMAPNRSQVLRIAL